MEPMKRQVPNMRQALGRRGVTPQMGGPAGGQGGFPPMPSGGTGPGPGLGRPQGDPNMQTQPWRPPQIGGNQNIGAQPKPGMGPDGGPEQVPTMPPGQQPPGGPPMKQGGWQGGGPGNPNGNMFQQWKQRHEQMKGFQPPGQGGQQQPGVRPDGSYPGPIVDGKQTYIKDGKVVGYDDFAGGQGQGGWQQAGGPFMEDYNPQQYPQGTYY